MPAGENKALNPKEQKHSEATVNEEIEEALETPPAYRQALAKKMERKAQTREKEKDLEEAEIRYQDFIIDLHNKFSRIALGLIAAILVFLGWAYRDLQTNAEANYDQLNLIWVGLLLVAFIVATLAFLWSNFIISRRHKVEKEKLLADQKIKVYTELSPNLPEIKEDEIKKSETFKSQLESDKKQLRKAQIIGYCFFAVATAATIALLLYGVDSSF